MLCSRKVSVGEFGQADVRDVAKVWLAARMPTRRMPETTLSMRLMPDRMMLRNKF